MEAEVCERIDGAEHAGRVYVLRLTGEGKRGARRALAAMPAEIRRRIAELAKWDVWRLVGYVYVRFPQFTSRSAAADDGLRCLPPALKSSVRRPIAGRAVRRVLRGVFLGGFQPPVIGRG